MAMSTLHDDLRLAHLLADNADSVALSTYRSLAGLVGDGTDGTAAATIAESIRATLKKARPRDAILDSVLGETGHGGRRWLVEPLDGASNHARGVPIWGSLVALEDDGQVVVAVASAPALNRRWWASREGGAWAGRSLLQPTELKVSDVATVAQCHLGFGEVADWVQSGRGQEFVDLMRGCATTRGYGEFWPFVLVAEGALDAAVRPDGELVQLAASSLLVTEAGGEFSSILGDAGPHGPGAIASNGLLHEELVRQLSGVEYTGPIPG